LGRQRPHAGDRRDGYGALLRERGVTPLVVASIVVRLPVPLVTVAGVLLVHAATGSFAAAGLAVASYAACTGVFGPLLGRAVDRRGQTAIVLASGIVSGGALLALVLAATGGAPTWAICLAAGAAGATEPPTAGCLRALWPELAARAGVPVPTAFALDTVAMEICFIGGPLLAGLLVALASPAAAVLTAAALVTSGAVLFAASPASRERRPLPRRAGSRLGPLVVGGFRALLTSLGAARVGLGLVTLALAAATVHAGRPADFGLLLAGQGVGSAVGGLLYGRHAWSWPPARRYAVLTAAFALGLLPLALEPPLPVFLLLMVASGLALAPSIAASYEVVDGLVSGWQKTEGYSWTMTAVVIGDALGTGIGGPLVEHAGASAVLVLASACVAAGAAVAALWLVPGGLRPRRARAGRGTGRRS
jgi:MFS family permease